MLRQKTHSSRALWLLLGCVVLWTGIVSVATISKLHHFGFDAIDLGIYTQVFHDTAQGDLFQFTIHPHSYLGDHFELFILVLAPLFKLWPSPEILLILQALGIALGIIPLWFLARKILSARWSWIVVGMYALYPMLFNISFFEFHILPFAIPLLLWLFYLYYSKKFFPFVLVMLLTLTVREDVALVVTMFGILALIERRSWKWILTPIIVGGAWFITAMKITGYLNQSGGYKFVALYSWLGDTPGEILKTVITKPWLPLGQIVSFNNLLLILGLTLPLAGLPLLRWKYYIPIALVALQLFLAPFSATINLETHYTSLLIPFIFIALVFALSKQNAWQQQALHWLQQLKPLPAVLLIAAIAYSFVTLSPISALYSQPGINREYPAQIGIKQAMVDTVAPAEPVVAGFDVLPQLANRDRIYSLHYAFLGHRQYSEVPLDIPRPITSVIFDATDFLVYQVQAQGILSYDRYYETGAKRIRTLIDGNNLVPISVADSMVQYGPGSVSNITLYTLDATPDTRATMTSISLDNSLTLMAWQRSSDYTPEVKHGQLVPLTFYWLPQQDLSEDYMLELQLAATDGSITYHKYYPLGYGLWPTSSWTVGQLVQTNYWFVIPDEFPLSDYTLQFQVVSLQGYMTLDALRSTSVHISESDPLGPIIPLTLE